MAHIFISHSKSDEIIKEFFRKTIENTPGLEPILMEYKNFDHQYAGKMIKQEITRKDCKCLIVLIGKRILLSDGYNYSFTHNWVGYEIGVAAHDNKPIIVFEENTMNFSDIVQFPVPYLNHYVQYKQDNHNSNYIGKLLRYNIPIPKDLTPIKYIRCPYTHCRAEYVYWNIQGMKREDDMYCPACRYSFKPFIDTNLRRPDRSGPMPSNVV